MKNELPRARLRRLPLAVVALAAILALGAACSGDSPAATDTAVPRPAATTPPAPSATRAAAVSPTTPGASPTPSSATPSATHPPPVGLAVNALAGELGVTPDQVEVLRVEPRDWPNSGLGCAEPGRAYLDVITPGYSILLGARGQQYEYHSDRMKLVVRCAAPRATVTARTTPVTTQPPVVQLAIADLARTAGVRPEDVTVQQVEQAEWSDSSLGCPEPGRAYLQVITPGYRITLTAGGRQYVYHTNRQNMVVRCDR